MKRAGPEGGRQERYGSPIDRLSEWYVAHCDGVWEHDERIRIQTIDNPGWMISINLRNTAWENKEFKSLGADYSDDDWYRCFIEDQKFIGAGGSGRLQFLIDTFLGFLAEAS